MTLISDSYRAQNVQLHNNPNYGRGGGKWAHRLTGWEGRDVLDYGCGKGALKKALDFDIDEYDPAVEGKDADPVPHDYVVCTDVLEHIEPSNLNDVLEHLQRLTLKEGFFVVSTKHAKKFLPDGRNAHLLVKPGQWWAELISEYFVITDVIQDVTQADEVVFYVEAKND